MAVSNNNIIIGVTGGIAAYKAPVLVRRLKEQGKTIKVVMTHGARHFITPLTLQAVSGEPVRDSLLDADAESGMDHIDLARWADTVIIAPASANFIAKLAHGFADDLLSTLCLATSARIYLAPAMNQQMWQNRATRENIAKIAKNGISILGPDDGDQACGEFGPGRMLDPLAIIECVFDQTGNRFHQDSVLSKRTEDDNTLDNTQDAKFANDTVKVNRDSALTNSVESGIEKPNNADPAKSSLTQVLITAGPTWEALDPVRGITNHSSGIMGYSIADAFSAAGFKTILISGPTALAPPDNVTFINVVSAQQMHNAVHEYIPSTDIFICVAAVADYRPELAQASKIKKSEETMQIKLIRNPDILKSVTTMNKHPFTVGFAAETDNVNDYAKSKLVNKNLDMIIANEVGDGKAFGQSTNALTVISRHGQQNLGPDSKTNLAKILVTIITDAYKDQYTA